MVWLVAAFNVSPRLLGRGDEILEGGVGTSSEVSTEVIGIGSWALPGAVDFVNLGSTPLDSLSSPHSAHRAGCSSIRLPSNSPRSSAHLSAEMGTGGPFSPHP